MPTGYTAIIEDKEDVTFKDYILGCARAFGACIDMRDEPQEKRIPKKFKVDSYHTKELTDSDNKLKELNDLSGEQLNERAEKEYKRELASLKRDQKRDLAMEDRYAKILEEVKAWIPPSKEHVGLKDFMIDQIIECTQYNHLEFYEEEFKSLKKVSGEAWYIKQVKNIEEHIKYHQKGLKGEIKKLESRNKWLEQLWGSLK